MNQVNFNPGEKRFEQLLKLYLKRRSLDPTANVVEHLDEDLLTAFAEGRLTKRVEASIVSHLIECSACRHSVFFIFRLTEQLEANTNLAVTSTVKSNSFHEFWNQLRVKVFNQTDNAVFAHQEAVEDEKQVRADSKENEQ